MTHAAFRLALLAAFTAVPAAAVAQTKAMAPHRAVYELKLSQSRASVVSVRGRILYDFSGSACDGYDLTFRQVSELNNGEGNVTLSDLRSTTWEDGAGKSYKFQSQNFVNQRMVDDVAGRAERATSGITVTLTKPANVQNSLDATVNFPTEHMARIIAAAREGKSLVELPVYDGSEKGEKVYSTLTVIGKEIAPDQRVPTDAAAGQADLAGMKRWPVTISYFDKSKSGGEQLPVYALSFEMYENGISRALLLDYNDFSISGEMTSLEIKQPKPCP